jgi:DNA-binding IclR family transcriptional regulator
MHSDEPQAATAQADSNYEVGSVDTALRLLIALGEQDELRLVDAGRLLGVSRSTAHRIMQMLVKYGFAAQNPDSRAYAAGPSWALFSSRSLDPRVAQAAQPALSWLVAQTGETVQLLTLRSNGNVVCLTAVEGTGVMRAAARIGDELPAWLTAGGRILLSQATSYARAHVLTRVHEVTPDSTPQELEQLHEAIARAGRDGFAVQRDVLELGTSAVSVWVRATEVRSYTIDVVLPTPRLTPVAERRIIRQATEAARQIEAAIAEIRTSVARERD